MPELRKDPVVGTWVIISAERAVRPINSIPRSDAPQEGLCPFCPGHEDKTPREVYALGRSADGVPNGPGWKVRVVPNRYPALMVEGELQRRGEGLYDRMTGTGAHEVIIETPDHRKGFPELTPTEVADVLLAYQARIVDLKNDQRMRYILLFKNHGSAAGASLTHSHSQLMALPVTPRHAVEEIEGAKRHYGLRERCIYCDIVDYERREGTRLIVENEHFVAVAPWAPKSPFETWILGKHHNSNFESEPLDRIRAAAEVLQSAMSRLDAALDHPAYNFIVHTNPLRDAPSTSYHWHIEIMPALTSVAGFEWGSGFFINPVAPEEAAAYLRKAGA